MSYGKPLTSEEYSHHFGGKPPQVVGTDPINPVRKNSKGKYFFWCNYWHDMYGPFDTHEDAVNALTEFAHSL